MKKYKKNCLFVGFIIISFAIILFTFFFIMPFKQPTKAEEINQNSEKQTEYKYFVKELSGKIAIFENGKDVPIETLNTQFEYLPEYDKKILRTGIYVENIEELNKILEDYED